ncbi:GAP family protein [Streptomyces sp. NPDC006553]|uniref:GAP family protein n=1 Tax=unclassified Streptomyces TaxID=2593676 RepID=UPI002258A50C|nr:GAP family protein [Streptomyces sp. NBC_00233]MCX5227491.1 GAP family protein [Streptomyces sp. NBC_00233]
MGDALGQVLPLALLDTLGVSTIALPVWFLLMPTGLRIDRVFGYLALVSLGYLVLGLVLLSTLAAVREDLGSALESPAGDTATGVAGGALLLLAAWYGLLRRERPGSGRLARRREQAVGRSSTAKGLITVSALAVVLEVATMFPYLAAIGILGDSALPWPSRAAVLAVHCLVMVAPAVLVTLARSASKGAVDRPLRRIDGWLRDNARENTAWLIALAGFILLSHSTAYDRITALLSAD